MVAERTDNEKEFDYSVQTGIQSAGVWIFFKEGNKNGLLKKNKQSQLYLTLDGGRLQFNISTTDPDWGDTLTLTTTPLPSGATFTDNGNGSGVFDWTPTSSQVGIYPITFRVSDGTLEDTETITITVNSEAITITVSNTVINSGGGGRGGKLPFKKAYQLNQPKFCDVQQKHFSYSLVSLVSVVSNQSCQNSTKIVS